MVALSLVAALGCHSTPARPSVRAPIAPIAPAGLADDRALAALGIDAPTRAAIARVAQLDTAIHRLEDQRAFGSELRARYRERDEAAARADAGIAAAGLAAGADVDTAALLAADLLDDPRAARARLMQAHGIAIDLALAARTGDAQAAARARFAVEWQSHERLAPVRVLPAPGVRSNLVASADGALVALFGDGLTLARFDTEEAVAQAHPGARVTAVEFVAGGRILAVAAEGGVELRDVATWERLASIPLPGAIASLGEGDHDRLVAYVEDLRTFRGEAVVIDLARAAIVARVGGLAAHDVVLVGDEVLAATDHGVEAWGLDGVARWTAPGTRTRLAPSGRAFAREVDRDLELVRLDPATGAASVLRRLPDAILDAVISDTTVVVQNHGDGAYARATADGATDPLGPNPLFDDAHRLAFLGDDHGRIVRLSDLRALAEQSPSAGTVRFERDAIFAHGWRWPRAGGAPQPCPVDLGAAVVVGRALAAGRALIDPATCRPVGTLPAIEDDDKVLAAWPDGRTVVVRHPDGAVSLLDVASGSRTDLRDEGTRATVLADGRLLLLSGSGLFVYARDGGWLGVADGAPIADPLGEGWWEAEPPRLRHHPDLATDRVDLEVALPPDFTEDVVAATASRRFAALHLGAVGVSDPAHPTVIRRDEPIGRFAIAPAGDAIAIDRGAELELVDIATGATTARLMPRGAHAWLRLDGDRISGTPLAIGELSALQWRAGRFTLPGWAGPVPR